MREFVDKTKISHMVYRPYWITVTVARQTLTYIVCEEFQKLFQPEKFDRETFTLEDGGTVGIDWACDKGSKIGRPQRSNSKSRPILILLPGLGGASDNLYTVSVWVISIFLEICAKRFLQLRE